MNNSFPRETVEFLPVNVTLDGQAVTSSVQFAVVADGSRPTTWAAPATLDGMIGVMVAGQNPGVYRVWAKVTDAPEAPVIDCGPYAVT